MAATYLSASRDNATCSVAAVLAIVRLDLTLIFFAPVCTGSELSLGFGQTIPFAERMPALRDLIDVFFVLFFGICLTRIQCGAFNLANARHGVNIVTPKNRKP